jgi:hypothetical protein
MAQPWRLNLNLSFWLFFIGPHGHAHPCAHQLNHAYGHEHMAKDDLSHSHGRAVLGLL